MSNERNPFDTYHIAPVTYDEKGRPTAEAPFTSTSDAKRHAVVVPPEKVIPVIFVPGIMGSNLRLKNLPEGFEEKRYKKPAAPKVRWDWPPVEVQQDGWGDMAWQPDGARFMAQKFWSLKAFERRRLLDPANTEVDDRAGLDAALKGFTFESAADGRQAQACGEQRRIGFVREMTRRGWGTLMVSSYGPLLGFLEKNLNNMYWRGELNDFWGNLIVGRKRSMIKGRGATHYEAADWGIVRGDKVLTPDDIKKASRYWFPVHAVGYNWLQSNIESGKYLASKIDGFMQHYRDLGYECKKVILVTHSMGGLVARAAVHPDIGNAASNVVGVIHGVMPTHGAPAAYRRCHAGFEGNSYFSKAGITSKILGDDGPEVAAVFSNSPGALQLLPSVLYGMGWLEVCDSSGSVVKRLPETDPYKEIYAEKEAWWRLMNPEWVDPKPNPVPKDSLKAWMRYLKNLREAGSYHSLIGEHSHDHTHIHYGVDDKDHRAFGIIRWRPNEHGQMMGDPVSSQDTHETKAGIVKTNDVWVRNGRSMAPANFKMAAQDALGDGTVPRRSGQALAAKAELVAEHAGYEHQGSYQDRRTQELVAYGIARLVSENE